MILIRGTAPSVLALALAAVGCSPGTPRPSPADTSAAVTRAPESAAPVARPDPGPPVAAGVGAARGDWRWRVAAPVYFEAERSDLTRAARRVLDEKVAVLRERPELRLRVTGYASEQESTRHHRLIAERRGAAVKRYLTQHGIAPDRISTSSRSGPYGACAPRDSGCRARSRRAEFAHLERRTATTRR